MSGADCSSPLRRIVLVLSVRAEVACVSVDFVGLMSFVFHYWGMDCSFLRQREVLQWSFVGFALTAIGSFLLANNGTEYL